VRRRGGHEAPPAYDEPELYAILHEARGAALLRSGVVDLPPAHKARPQVSRAAG
jgi:hypothetical protein